MKFKYIGEDNTHFGLECINGRTLDVDESDVYFQKKVYTGKNEFKMVDVFIVDKLKGHPDFELVEESNVSEIKKKGKKTAA